MTRVKIKLEILTHMFSSGVGSEAEFRVTELKSLLRNTFREFYFFKSIEDMNEKEEKLFGSTKKRSVVSIKMQEKIRSKQKECMLPRIKDTKKVSSNCIKNGKEIELYLDSYKEEYLKMYIQLLKLAALMGALGKRSRKGFGAFKIKNILTQVNEIDTKIDLDPIEILEKSSMTIEGTDYNIRKYNWDNKKSVVCFKEEKMDFPYAKKVYILSMQNENIEPMIKHISELSHERLYKSGLIGNKWIENKKNIDSLKLEILGNYKESRERFASPIYITFSENKGIKYLVIKELNYNYRLKELKKFQSNIKEIQSNTKEKEYVQAYIDKVIEGLGGKKECHIC